MPQCKKHSIFEALTSTAIGYAIAVLTQIVVFPLFDMQVSINDNLSIGAIFTIVSVIRSYVIRRIFNKL